MTLNRQAVSFFPIAAFLVEKVGGQIVAANNKGMGLANLSSGIIQSHSITEFIDDGCLRDGEFTNCRFQVNEQTVVVGNLNVQECETDFWIVSFWNERVQSVDSNTNQTEMSGLVSHDYLTKATVELSTDSIAIVQDEIMQYVNKKLIQVSGYNPSEIIGQNFAQFVDPAERERVYSFFNKRQRGETSPTQYESVAMLFGGKKLDVEVSVVTIVFNGKPAYQITLRDITKRKVAERKYQNIINFAPVGFYQTSRDGEFLIANNELAYLLGYNSGGELVGRNIEEFYYSAADRESLIQKYDRTQKSDVKNIEVRLRKKDGSPIWVLMTARAIKDEHLITQSYDGFINDISGRKKQELVQKMLLSLSKRSMTNIGLPDFLATVHGDLKKVLKAENFYVALFDSDSMKYRLPYHVDEFDEFPSDTPIDLTYSLTDLVRNSNKGMIVTAETQAALVKKYLVEPKGKAAKVWMGVPLVDSETDSAYGVLVVQDYSDTTAYTDDDLQTLSLIAGTIGLFVDRVKNLESLKMAKELAEEGMTRYRALFYDNKSVILLIDSLSMDIVDANSAACEFYGYPYHELTSLKISQINMLSEQEIRDEMRNAMTDRRRSFQFKHRLAGGEVKDVEVFAGSVTVGKKRLLYSIITDISKRKKAEEQVLKLTASVEQSPVITVITDLEGNIQYVNSAFEQVTGYSKDEAIGRNPRFLQSGNTNPDVYNELWASILNDQTWTGELVNQKKNGEIFIEKATITPIKDDSGKTINFLAVKDDITSRKKQLAEIARLSKAIEQMPSPVALTDKEGVFVYVNPKMCEVTGYTASELIGISTRILKSGEHTSDFYKELWDTINAGEIWIGEMINRKKNGEFYIESVRISAVFDANGEVINFIKVSNDISVERQLLNELIQAKEKAEESDRLKSAFLANMSHEIRTPMNGILGFTGLLLEPDLQEEDKEQFLRIIYQSGIRLMDTVSDLVEISKIEAGIVDVKSSTFDIHSAVIDLVRFFQPQADEKNLKLEFRTESHQPNLMITSDKGKFDSVLTNLIRNALKFTNKGTVSIEYAICEGQLQFCIEDTGVGIPEHRHKAIFNRFEQADNDFSRAFEGSGLGLAIAKSYVEMIGGQIWLESTVGLGSRFYFTLPLLSVKSIVC
ncbi:PAS domain S-box protein [Mangrovibacterium sp.]|uniref:PAS domain S-box protein n=1 Tax=Mangrovibacterium sp. TaxID=1961364 RepID=UPI0035616B0B